MKRAAYTLIALLLSFGCLYGQPYQIGRTTITFNDPDRGNRAVPTEICYPADSSGADVPVTALNNNTFPVVVFGHGFMMDWSAYGNICSALVPKGYIVAFPATEGTLSPSHDAFGKDLAFLVRAVTDLGNNQSSLFHQRVGNMNCVMGHSMGGGAAYIAAADEPDISAIATLAPAETSPSAKAAAASVSIPALIIAGGNDCVTPPQTHQIPIYDSLISSCKTYISIIGGSHCQMADFNFFCNIGESTCTPPPAITRSTQHEIISRFLVPWLEFQLKGDAAQGALFDNLILTDSSVTHMKTCDLVTTVKKPTTVEFAVRVYPNPVSDLLRVSMEPAADALFILYDLAMRKLIEVPFNGITQISLAFLQKGVYLYSVKSGEGTLRSGKLIKE